MSGLSGLTLLAVLCAAAAVAASRPVGRVPQRGDPAIASATHWLAARRYRPPKRAGLWAVAGCLPVGLWAGGPLTAVSAVIVSVGIAWVHRRRAGHRAKARRSAAWQSALGRCAAELQAGADLPAALLAGAGGERDGRAPRDAGGPAARLTAAGAAAQAGGEPWRWLAETGDPTGRALAACLSLAAKLGAAPAPLIVRLASAEAAEELRRREADVAVASAMATGRLLAVLPLAGIGLAAALGTSAPRFLLDSLFGQLSLLIAAIFETAGLLWLERLLPADGR